MADRLLTPECKAYLGPVAVAQFLEVNWLQGWPLTWTRIGLRAAGNGYGLWSGTQQRLPIDAEPSRFGAAFWEGRRARPAAPLVGDRS